jgi:hypothetical protein
VSGRRGFVRWSFGFLFGRQFADAMTLAGKEED